ncbi:MAG: YbaB/EbfC family nucleoid-associated protein [Candidatus Dormiibacterota bacterium]
MNQQMKMMQQVQRMQAKMAKVQEDLEKEEIEATAGGGAVKATVNGQQRLLAVAIDPDVADDVEMLQDLIVAAVNEASEQSKTLAAERMQEVTAGMGLPPGLI